jgi:transcriptional regulator with AAA-type ATPase domain
MALSRLFGHSGGVFAGGDSQRDGALQEAHGGCLFLDEVEHLPLPLQSHLLQVLTKGEVRRINRAGQSADRRARVRF